MRKFLLLAVFAVLSAGAAWLCAQGREQNRVVYWPAAELRSAIAEHIGIALRDLNLDAVFYRLFEREVDE